MNTTKILSLILNKRRQHFDYDERLLTSDSNLRVMYLQGCWWVLSPTRKGTSYIAGVFNVHISWIKHQHMHFLLNTIIV